MGGKDMPTQMRAAQFDEVTHPRLSCPYQADVVYPQTTGKVQVNTVSVPKISADNQILVKIASASLCHSDLMLLDGVFPGPGRPVTIGHEACGYVEQVGSGVKNFKPGDRIGFLYITGGCCMSTNSP